MKIRAEIEFEIDDEDLALHDGNQKPPPNDPDDWEFRDLFRAEDEALIEDGVIVSIERIG